jgi:hypothetical protein
MRNAYWFCIVAGAGALAVSYWPSTKHPRAVSPALPATQTSEAQTPQPPAAQLRPQLSNLQGAHLVALPLTAAGRPRARNAGIERALAEDEADATWTAEVDTQARERLAGDPALHIDALQCTHTFCRIQMTKPIDSNMDWEAVDQALTPIARGETIFAAERDGAETTGYLYFASVGSSLPIDQVHEAANRRGDWSP